MTDASQIGLAFWSPDLNLSFVAPIEESDDQFGNIFFNEDWQLSPQLNGQLTYQIILFISLSILIL